MKFFHFLRYPLRNCLHSWRRGSIAAVVVALLTGPAAAQVQKNPRAKDNRGRQQPLVIAKQGSFYVGGRYVTGQDGQIMTGQMYVRYQIPQNLKHEYPIVFIHGGGTAGALWEETPDGREGWETFFVREGYGVYVVDQPSRGRSAVDPSARGRGPRSSSSSVEARHSVAERYNMWPQARLHTQWPGAGVAGDPVFDQFYAAQVNSVGAPGQIEEWIKAAGLALLDRIGPAIVVGHSQSGNFLWILGDARPKLVKALVGLEPGNPPFYDVTLVGPPDWFKYSATPAKPWGLTRVPLTYDPPVTDPAELKPVQEAQPQGPDLVPCYRQSEPAHKLPNLRAIPIVILTSEASFHAPFDHCTAQYLSQAGVQNTFIQLSKIGIHGNGHFLQLEKNSLQIARLVANWLEDHLDKKAQRVRNGPTTARTSANSRSAKDGSSTFR
jgi:pimeloyl-ACP methyl ester carboxylesterase